MYTKNRKDLKIFLKIRSEIRCFLVYMCKENVRR
nr:MAG TPA: hypothetical protein [Caudoviricetes sp.]